MTGDAMREAVARAIWAVQREDEDRCDMELEDTNPSDSVWKKADAAIAAMAHAAVVNDSLTTQPAGATAEDSSVVRHAAVPEVAAALELVRARDIVEQVRTLPIGGHDADAPAPFQSGYALACEEIAERLGGGTAPIAAAQEPVAWTPKETLANRQTTTRGYLWFTNPQNYSWAPLYAAPVRTNPPRYCSDCGKRLEGVHTCSPQVRRDHES